MSEIEDTLARVEGFNTLTIVNQIKVFGWYLQQVEKNTRFSGSDLLRCFDQAGLKRPANISKQLDDLCKKTPPEVLKDRNGYYLERRVRETFDSTLGLRDVSIQVSALLKGLPKAIPSVEERDFFEETLTCYKYGAFRATVVMMWNLGYSHFCDWILKNHKDAFNTQWPIRFPEQNKKAKVKAVSTIDHFAELKESEVIEVARSAGLMSQGIQRTLQEKLAKRNGAAHPSAQVFSQLQAEEFIHDLVVNVMLKLV